MSTLESTFKGSLSEEITKLTTSISNYSDENMTEKEKIIQGIKNYLNSSPDSQFKIIENQSDSEDRNTTIPFLLMNFLLVPTFMMFCSLVFGVILGLVEGWSIWDGFTYIAANLTGSSYVYNNDTPTNIVGVALDVVISVYVIVIQTSVGTVVSIGSFLKFEEYMDNTKGTIFLLLIVPIGLVLLAFISGVLISLLESDITIYEGFEFMISNICGLGNPLTNVQPDTRLAITLSLFISCYTFSFLGIILGIGGSLPMFEDFMSGWEDLFNMKNTVSIDKNNEYNISSNDKENAQVKI